MTQHQFGKKSGYIQPTSKTENKAGSGNNKSGEENSGNFKNDSERATEAGVKGDNYSHRGQNNNK